jgi:hypothetical protein
MSAMKDISAAIASKQAEIDSLQCHLQRCHAAINAADHYHGVLAALNEHLADMIAMLNAGHDVDTSEICYEIEDIEKASAQIRATGEMAKTELIIYSDILVTTNEAMKLLKKEQQNDIARFIERLKNPAIRR